MGGLKELFDMPWLHLEIMKGSILQNERYCSKEGHLVHYGLPFIGKGGRRDAQVYYEKVRTGANDLELADHDFAAFARFMKATDRIRVAIRPKPKDNCQVILLVGPTGVGKTRQAYEDYPELYELPVGPSMWFDGYQGQKEVLIDEFSGQLPLNDLLKLLDTHYVRKFPIKGGFTWFNPQIILVTSNFHPNTWYDYSSRQEHELALRRRITKVIKFNPDTTQTIYTGPRAVQVFWPVKVLSPREKALGEGNLCHKCYIIPCICSDVPEGYTPSFPDDINVID